jgi:hypothetical protein
MKLPRVNDFDDRFQRVSARNQPESHRFLPEDPGKGSDLEAGIWCLYSAPGYASILCGNGKNRSPDSDTLFLLPFFDPYALI